MTISQTTPDSLKISPEQVRNVYFGLKSAERYKQHYADCLEVANSLNEIIQQQNDSLIALDQRMEEYNYHINELYSEREQTAVEIQKIKSKKTPWYKSKWLWAAVGFAGGVWIAK